MATDGGAACGSPCRQAPAAELPPACPCGAPTPLPPLSSFFPPFPCSYQLANFNTTAFNLFPKNLKVEKLPSNELFLQFSLTWPQEGQTK